MIAFEYPLNEKTRSYLRFEFLFLQIKKSISFETESDITVFFKAFFELLELSERCDIRHDLTKDLRILSDQVNTWLGLKEVDDNAVLGLISEMEDLISSVSKMPKQLRFFKNNRFLTSLKQRFFIPSGNCNFDLPQFHYWLAKDLKVRQKDAQTWFEHFAGLEKALTLFLKIKRSQGHKSQQTAINGFYQGEVENCSFVIVEIDEKQEVYPMISGHKNRYSVRFMSADSEVNASHNISFQQIYC